MTAIERTDWTGTFTPVRVKSGPNLNDPRLRFAPGT